jgi:diketogulonate reductase-like aldo/keto reductase
MTPRFLYGTAWKEERTRALTEQALAAGFTGIDTANQRKHYHEAAVGEAIRGRPRDSLFLQTKFTYPRGQDHRLPYDPAADLPTQVRQSFASSLEHLHTDRLDAYLLHGPERGGGLSDGDWQVWRTMEALKAEGRVRQIGVSNVSLGQLELLCREATPAFVQNRCYARTRWDLEIRALCRARGIVYQGFSLLTANPRALASPAVLGAARRTGKTPAQIVFRFALEVGMWPLTGSSSPTHLREDLECLSFSLEPEEVRAIERAEG